MALPPPPAPYLHPHPPASGRSPHKLPHGVFWLFQTVFSLLADCLCTGSAFWNRADRLLGMLGALAFPVRLVWSAPPWNKMFILAAVMVSVPFLAFSREAKTFAQYRFRHALWHVISCACLLWAARREVGDGFASESMPYEATFWGWDNGH